MDGLVHAAGRSVSVRKGVLPRGAAVFGEAFLFLLAGPAAGVICGGVVAGVYAFTDWVLGWDGLAWIVAGWLALVVMAFGTFLGWWWALAVCLMRGRFAVAAVYFGMLLAITGLWLGIEVGGIRMRHVRRALDRHLGTHFDRRHRK